MEIKGTTTIVPDWEVERFWMRVRTKDCHVCNEPKDVLYRCRYYNLTDWVFVCGKCVNEVKQTHDTTYQYGGTWKSKKK